MSQEEQVREFRADSVKAALAEIRRALGPDAIILDQRRDGREIIVRACAEDMQPAMPAESNQEPSVPELTSRLRERGFAEAELARHGRLPSAADAVKAFVDDLTFAGAAIPSLRGCFRFLGSAGVGKTSLIVKLAAEWVLHNPPERLLLVTTDQQTLGGTEALHLAAQLLGVEVVDTAAERLATLLAERRDCDLVLIDTAGFSTVQPRVAPSRARNVLVVSALHHPAHVTRQVDALHGLALAGLCLTHVDQVDGLAEPVLSAVRGSGLPLYWISLSAGVPDGLEVASPAWAAELLGADREAGQRAALELTVG